MVKDPVAVLLRSGKAPPPQDSACMSTLQCGDMQGSGLSSKHNIFCGDKCSFLERSQDRVHLSGEQKFRSPGMSMNEVKEVKAVDVCSDGSLHSP